MFSKACEYGIKASIFIALKSYQEMRVSLKDIAAEINSPEAFTAKILQKLVKNSIIDSTKGAHGGFNIDLKKMSKTKLSEIVNAIDGDSIYKGCALGLNECDDIKPCPLHDKFKLVREDLKTMLQATSLEDLAFKLENGTAFLKL